MPRTKVADTRDLIQEKMKEEGRKYSWLSQKTGINYSTLISILNTRIFPLTERDLKKINEVLETEFELCIIH